MRAWPRAVVIGAIWFAIGLFNGSDRYLRGRAAGAAYALSWWGSVSPSLVRAAIWAGLTPVFLSLARRFPAGRWREPRVFLAYAASTALLSLVANFLDVAVRGLTSGYTPILRPSGGPALQGAAFALLGFHVLTGVALAGVAAGLESARSARESELRTSRLAGELSSARLEVLQMQLHPHFLFNTLNIVMGLISEDPGRAAGTVAQLRALFASSLQNASALSTVAAEADFLRRYLAIQETRFGDRLSAELRIEAGCEDVRLPHLILQPLVENAIRHGIAINPESGRVEVRAGALDGRLVLEVLDDGPGFEDPSSRASGVGLANTRTRLLHLYGSRHVFEIANRPGGGAAVRIEIPLTRSDAATPVAARGEP